MTGKKTNNLSDAIRNLIVCDTQFGWNGATTLKLPELLDLQARGWLIEGDENNEFSLTTEGESVVAQAIQRADKPATTSAHWTAEGQPDPHGRRYDCERAALTLGNLTDDELANAVFLHGNEQPTMADLAAGKALAGIVYLTAAKDRIRWLSRALVDETCKQPLQVGEVQGCDELSLRTDGERAAYLEGIEEGKAQAARQPGAQEPVAYMVRWRSAGGWGLRMPNDMKWFRDRADEYEIRDLVFPPAQGIDLGQEQDAARWRAIAPLLSVEWDEDEQLKRWTWIDFKGDAPAIPSPTRQEYTNVDEAVDALIRQRDAAAGPESRTDHLLDRRNRLMNSYGNSDREDAAIDAQIAQVDAELAVIDRRDAAPGVVISQGTHDPSGVGNG